MKARTIALSCAALVCRFATPALAGDGWYIGLAAGLSMPNDPNWRSIPAPATNGVIRL